MTYPASVKCSTVLDVMARMDWAAQHGMIVVHRTWEVINSVQHVTFDFVHQEDAVAFKLRWS